MLTGFAGMEASRKQGIKRKGLIYMRSSTPQNGFQKRREWEKERARAVGTVITDPVAAGMYLVLGPYATEEVWNSSQHS